MSFAFFSAECWSAEVDPVSTAWKQIRELNAALLESQDFKNGKCSNINVENDMIVFVTNSSNINVLYFFSLIIIKFG